MELDWVEVTLFRPLYQVLSHQTWKTTSLFTVLYVVGHLKQERTFIKLLPKRVGNRPLFKIWRTPVTPSSSSRYHRRRSSGSRDERYRSGERHTWGGRVLDDTPVGHLVSGPAVCRSHRPGELRVINTEVTSLTTRGAITSDTRAHLYVN